MIAPAATAFKGNQPAWVIAFSTSTRSIFYKVRRGEEQSVHCSTELLYIAVAVLKMAGQPAPPLEILGRTLGWLWTAC